MYYYLIQSLCFHCKLLKESNDSTHEGFYIFSSSVSVWLEDLSSCAQRACHVQTKKLGKSNSNSWKEKTWTHETSSERNSREKVDFWNTTLWLGVYKIKGSDTEFILFSKQSIYRQHIVLCKTKLHWSMSAPLSPSCGPLQDVSAILWAVFFFFK